MPRAYASGIVPAGIDTAWELVRDFNGLSSWHPAIAASEIEPGAGAGEPGSIRTLTLDGGGVVRERLLRLDDVDHSYTYEFVESPFPARRYVSTIRLAPVTATGETFVEWWSEFDADGADEENLVGTFRDGVYGVGIKGLARTLS